MTTASPKSYDSTNVVKVLISNVAGIIEGDDVEVPTSVNGTFADSNVGNNILVTIVEGELVLTGTDSSNYRLAEPNELKADITTNKTAKINKQ
mgnify:CR=1 FL=1